MNGLSIVDSHVHLWDTAKIRFDWLNGLPLLKRTFDAMDFAAASANSNVGKMVFIEAGCAPEQSLAEVDWVSGLAKTEPRLKGIVAHAPLEKGEDVRAELDALASRKLVKGIRRNLQGEHQAKVCLRTNFLAGVKILSEYGFSLDLCIRSEQLSEVTELVSQVPQVSFVLDHCGKPDVRSRVREPWARDLKTLSALPNVACKISGLATEADWEKWQPSDVKFYVEWVVECFGFDRILFGSDWPVSLLATNYESWLATIEGFFSSASDDNRLKYFQTNVERIYRV